MHLGPPPNSNGQTFKDKLVEVTQAYEDIADPIEENTIRITKDYSHPDSGKRKVAMRGWSCESDQQAFETAFSKLGYFWSRMI
jgi:hypothetical protein